MLLRSIKGACRAAALALLVTAGCAAPASAELRRVALDSATEVIAYGASGGQHIALTQSPAAARPQIFVSSDGGRSFVPIADDASMFVSDVSIDPDGRRWMVARISGQPGSHLLTATPGSPWTDVRAFPPAEHPTAPVLTPAGRLLAITRQLFGTPSTTRLELHRVADDGTDTLVADVAQTEYFDAHISADPQGAWLRAGDGIWYVGAGGQVTNRPAWTPDVSGLGSDVRMLDSRLYRIRTAEIWWPVVDTAMTRISDLFPVEGGTFVRGSGDDASATSTVIGVLSAPQVAGPRGELASDTKQLVDASNAIRVQQGLPALIGDPSVSVASRNHAAYDRRWHEAHTETPGREGFTGADPSARCAAVEASCGGEIMHYREIADGVSDWWATPLHRFITGGPAVVAVGAGAARDSRGTTEVMNIASGTSGVVVAPLGLPRGNWEGQLGFGGESPDPGTPCGIHAPYGTAVTVYGYADPATGAEWAPGPISLLDVTAGSSPVRGCADSDYFLPDETLQAGHVYAASTTYTSGSEPPRPFSWTFTTKGTSAGANPAPETACLSVSRRPARVSVKALRRGIAVRIRSCVLGSIRLELRRGRGLPGSRVLARRTIKIANHRTRTIRFVGRDVRPGTVTLRVAQAGRVAKAVLTVRR